MLRERKSLLSSTFAVLLLASVAAVAHSQSGTKLAAWSDSVHRASPAIASPWVIDIASKSESSMTCRVAVRIKTSAGQQDATIDVNVAGSRAGQSPQHAKVYVRPDALFTYTVLCRASSPA